MGVGGWLHLPQDVVVDASAHQPHLTRRLVAGVDYPTTYRGFVEMSPGEDTSGSKHNILWVEELADYPPWRDSLRGLPPGICR